MTIRQPAVAGSFYPADAGRLGATVDSLIDAAEPATRAPKAIIAPHAGYPYSGPVAGSAFRAMAPAVGTIRRVVLIGPSHFVPFRGFALPGHDAFRTPLGEVPLDHEGIETARAVPQVVVHEGAHRQEHALEVELPFLQRLLGDFTLVPLVTGRAQIGEIAAVLAALWGGEETAIVISSDLSHFHPYAAAQARDLRTAEAIERLDAQALGPDDACGHLAVGGLLEEASRRRLAVQRLDLRNSGDTAGDKGSVVGYGAWAFSAPS